MAGINKVDARALREYRERYEAVAEIELGERRRRTVAERLRQIVLLYEFIVSLGLLAKAVAQNDADAEIARQRWRKLKAVL